MTEAPCKPCPFCGSRPHQGSGKTQYDQLHGEPLQNWDIWCPKLHAKVTGPSKFFALLEWNTRSCELEEKE